MMVLGFSIFTFADGICNKIIDREKEIDSLKSWQEGDPLDALHVRRELKQYRREIEVCAHSRLCELTLCAESQQEGHGGERASRVC